jgi:hypothetical protein
MWGKEEKEEEDTDLHTERTMYAKAWSERKHDAFRQLRMVPW